MNLIEIKLGMTKLLFIISCFLLTSCQPPQYADTVFRGGTVVTMDDERSHAQAVAIYDGKIIFVGSNQNADSLMGVDTKIIELEGKMLMPSFHDAHSHVRAGGSSLNGCSLHSATDISAIRNKLIECANLKNYGVDEWVIGGGWPLSAFPEAGPTSAMLDEVFNNRPAVFFDAFAHSAWLSSRALELAKIDKTTPDPPQGVIVRDTGTGIPTGTLRDAAVSSVISILPAEEDEDRYSDLLLGIREANKFGITAFIDPGVSEQGLKDYQAADRRDELSARVITSLSPIGSMSDKFGPEIFDLLSIRDQYRSDLLDVDSVKVYVDGVIETRTSFMLEPYLDGSNFPPFYHLAELKELYAKLDKMGIQIHTHAIGDAAIRSALDAYEHTISINGRNDNRHQIVHLQLIDDEDIPRFGELGIAANFQCMWCYRDVYIDLAVDIVGEKRTNAFYAVNSIKNSGGLIVGGSDWDVSSLNPLDAIETAITRKDPFSNSGVELGVGQQIDLTDALDMYTRNAAHVMRLEKKTGSIEVGKFADLIVLNANLYETPVEDINEVEVLLTLLNGEVIYTAPNHQDLEKN